MAQRRRRKKKKRIFGKVIATIAVVVLISAVALAVINFLPRGNFGEESESSYGGEKEVFSEKENFERELTLGDYSNMTKEEAERDLKQKGFVVSISEEENTEIAEGTVIRQLPSAGAVVEAGARVRIFVSSGSARFELDDYSGVSAKDVRSELTALGVDVVEIKEHSDIEADGNVFYQEPTAGTTVRKGDSVTIYVSMGAGTVKVPDLRGLGESRAEEKLMESGLHLGSVTEVESEEDAGSVVKQSIAPNTEVEIDTVIDVTVSCGKGSSRTSENGL